MVRWLWRERPDQTSRWDFVRIGYDWGWTRPTALLQRATRVFRSLLPSRQQNSTTAASAPPVTTTTNEDNEPIIETAEEFDREVAKHPPGGVIQNIFGSVVQHVTTFTIIRRAVSMQTAVLAGISRLADALRPAHVNAHGPPRDNLGLQTQGFVDRQFPMTSTPDPSKCIALNTTLGLHAQCQRNQIDGSYCKQHALASKRIHGTCSDRMYQESMSMYTYEVPEEIWGRLGQRWRRWHRYRCPKEGCGVSTWAEKFYLLDKRDYRDHHYSDALSPANVAKRFASAKQRVSDKAVARGLHVREGEWITRAEAAAEIETLVHERDARHSRVPLRKDYITHEHGHSVDPPLLKKLLARSDAMHQAQEIAKTQPRTAKDLRMKARARCVDMLKVLSILLETKGEKWDTDLAIENEELAELLADAFPEKTGVARVRNMKKVLAEMETAKLLKMQAARRGRRSAKEHSRKRQVIFTFIEDDEYE
jgi:hypothetical protein